MNPKKRILIFSMSCGGGHNSAAKALANALNKRKNAVCKIIDVMDLNRTFSSKAMIGFWKRFFPFSAQKFSIPYGLVYYLTDNSVIWNLVHFFIFKRFKSILLSEIIKNKADIVISVIPVLNSTLADAIREMPLRVPFHIAVLDPLTFHTSWFESRADKIYIGTQEAKDGVVSHGISESKVSVTGIPIDMKFYGKKMPKSKARKLYGLDKDKFTVILLGGGEGSEKILKIVKEIIESQLKVNIIVVCGKNANMRKKLHHYPIKIFGYTHEMEKLMDASDLAITKAGPTTIEECVVKGLPIIIMDYIPGQERGNIKYAKSKTLAYYPKRAKDIPAIVRDFMLNNLNSSRKYVLAKKRPALLKIADSIYDTLRRY